METITSFLITKEVKMYKRSLILAAIISAIAMTTFGQTDIRMRKKVEIKMPGMEAAISDADISKMPANVQQKLKNFGKSEKTVYVKDSRIRTDLESERPSGMKMKKVRHTIIDQCDKQRTVQFDDDKSEYTATNYTAASPQTLAASAKPSKPGGKVQITVTGTDTGERMKLFGYDARHLRQKITMTPSGNTCMKAPMTVEIDGWYADVPTYACSIKPDSNFRPDMGMGQNCNDDVNVEIKGVAITGIPLKEVKVIQTDGQSITSAEEVIELVKTSLDPAFFEAPAGYKLSKGSSEPNTFTAEVSESSVAQPSSLEPPSAGVVTEISVPLPEKKGGLVRIGIAAPVADMGNDFEGGGDTVSALRNTLAVALRNENTETIMLESSLPEQEAKQKQCDYVFYSKVTRKKGGGMFGGMMGPMLAGAAAGMIPGVGGIVASVATSVITASTISGGFKSKDEIAFEYRVQGTDGTALIPATASKQKAKKNGEDVLTPQIQQAATATLAKAAKPQP
jgi:hypothetical protein